MAAVSDVLFSDDDLKEMYSPDNGRPSLPPSLMSGVLLLQFETMHMIRTGQVRGAPKGDFLAHVRFIQCVFGLAA